MTLRHKPPHWAPAIRDLVTQAVPKLIVFEGDGATTFPLVWIGVALFLPLTVYFVPSRGNGVVQ